MRPVDLLAHAVATAADAGARLLPGGRTRLTLLMYHGVVEAALSPFCWHMLPLGAFERQIAWVRRHLHVLPLEEALERMRRGDLPPRACAVTFDDGFRSVRDLALPVLARHGVPATVFLVTDLVGTLRVPWPDRLYLAVRSTDASVLDARALGLGDLPLGDDALRARALAACLRVLKERPVGEKREILAALLGGLGAREDPDPAEFRLMDWEDVRALAAGGRIAFGAHTTLHEMLSRQPDEEIERTIAASQAEVTRRLGRAPSVFAYPNGRTIDFDERAKAALRRLGVPWALSTETGRAHRGSDPLALPRVCVGADLPLGRFRLLCRGLWG